MRDTRSSQQRMERCSLLTAKSLIKQAEANSYQAVGVTIKKKFNLEAAIELRWNDAKKNQETSGCLRAKPKPKQAQTKKKQQNVIAFYWFITNDCTTSVEFLKVKINVKIKLLKLDGDGLKKYSACQ